MSDFCDECGADYMHCVDGVEICDKCGWERPNESEAMTETKRLEDKFVIWCVERSRQFDAPVYWNPNNCGYTTDVRGAGVYTQKQVEEAKHTWRDDFPLPLGLALMLSDRRDAAVKP